MFQAHEMGKAFGVYGPVMGLSAMLGPIAAGGLISANVLGTGWRMIFLVNVPVGLAALVLGARTLPAGVSSGARRLDLPGALLAGAGMFLLVFPGSAGIRCAVSARAATRWSSRPCSGTARTARASCSPSCSPARSAAS
jgi:hypothetical protein